jgi:hypothetical protein
VLFERGAHFGAVAGNDRDDDLLGGSAGTQRIPQAAIDVRVADGRSGKNRRSAEREAQQSGSGQAAHDFHAPQ